MRRLLIAAGAAALLAVGAGGAEAQGKLKVCFIYVGPHNDGGYSETHDIARQAVEKELGSRVETTYVESVPEGPDAERTLDRLAQSGCGMIFATSFGFMDPTVAVAKKYPNVKFEHATGFKQAPNLSIYNLRWYEGRYVMGQIAGKMSKAGVAGYIGSFPIPEVVMGINAFMLGAQSVNPNFKIKTVWANSWFDPAKEGDAAKVLLSQGVDILVQHTDSPAPMQIAEQQGKLAFGQSLDQSKFGPKAHLTSLVDNWGPYYIRRVKAALDGTWKSEDVWEGFSANLVVLSTFTNMPDDVKKMANETIDKIKSGAFHPFTGPISKQDGTVMVKAGEKIADKDLLGMNWYVKGIDDKLPQ